jgi:hypothetical protein
MNGFIRNPEIMTPILPARNKTTPQGRYMYVHKILHMSASDMCKICTSLLQTCAKFSTCLKQTCAKFAHVWIKVLLITYF